MSIVDYTPPPTIAAFIASEKKYTFCLGPIGAGKSVGGIFKALYHAKMQAPDPSDGIRYTRFLVVRNTNKELHDTTLKTFFDWFPPGIAGDWQATQKTFVFNFGDIHCEILFRALDRPEDASSVLSMEITGAMLDECVEIPREIVDAVESRCGRYPSKKRGGCSWYGMWGVTNAGNQDSWWYDWLTNEWPEEAGGAAVQEEVLNYFVQPSGFSPNAENLENLPPYKAGCNDYYHDKAKGKKPEWVAQFIECQWGYSQRGKPVYKAFNRDIHVAKQPLKFNPHLPLVLGFDAGLTPAMVFMQQDSFGRVLILDELVSDNMGAQRFCREKVRPLINRKYQGATILVAADPATKQRAQTDERTVASVVEKELGVRVKGATSNDLAARLGAVDGFLTLLTEAGPALLIDPSCKSIIAGFASGYRYAVNNKGATADKPDKNMYSHCFVGDTLVDIDTGCKPIRDIRVGENVRTPRGYKPVTATMCATANGVLDLEFSDGTKIVCTEDHPFVTKRGKILARDLSHSDILFSINEENVKCRSKNTLLPSSWASAFTGSLAAIWSATRNTPCMVSDICTALFGLKQMALYRAGFTFITETRTRPITICKTSNSCLPRSTYPRTIRTDASVTLTQRDAGLRQHKQQPQRGIDQTLGGSGTGSTLFASQQTPSERQEPALGVGSSTKEQRTELNAHSVLCRAKARLESLLGSMTKIGAALCAEQNTDATSTTRKLHAVRLVRRKWRNESVMVYDLTVADEHVFFANGVLVGNCHDALQYGAMAFVADAAREARARKLARYPVQSRNTYVY